MRAMSVRTTLSEKKLQKALDRVYRAQPRVAERYPGVISGATTAVEACLYTNSPDERFVLERRGRIVVGSACNGHGFQFAPQTGERLAQLALEPVGSSVVRS